MRESLLVITVTDIIIDKHGKKNIHNRINRTTDKGCKQTSRKGLSSNLQGGNISLRDKSKGRNNKSKKANSKKLKKRVKL